MRKNRRQFDIGKNVKRAIPAPDYHSLCAEVIGKSTVTRVPTILCKLVSPGAVSLVLRWPCARPAQSIPRDHAGAYFEANKQVSTVFATIAQRIVSASITMHLIPLPLLK